MTSNNIDGTLRASEFAVTLNGDNYQAILKALKQFAATVKKERRFALSQDGDDDDDDDDVIDEFSVGTISSAQYLGTAESITVASNRMTKKVAKYVAEMVSFNAEP